MVPKMELSGRGGLWFPARWYSQVEVSSCPQDDGTFSQIEFSSGPQGDGTVR